MARISISSVLEARKRVRIMTILASFVLMFALVQGLVFNNPKNSKASMTDRDGSVMNDAIGRVLLDGNVLIDQNGAAYKLSFNGTTNWDGDIYIGGVYYQKIKTEGTFIVTSTGINVTGMDVVVNSNRSVYRQVSRVYFVGGTVSLKSLTVKSGGTLTHLGPSSQARYMNSAGVWDSYEVKGAEYSSVTGVTPFLETVTINAGSVANSFTGGTLYTNGIIDSTGLLADGALRGIDLRVSGDFSLDSGAKIDVSEKGFRGGNDGTCAENGFGPGGGITGGDSNSAGGGSYGGLGGWSLRQSFNSLEKGSAPGETYGTYLNPIDMGSGGGGAAGNCNEPRNSGHGGGVVLIEASNISIYGAINANGGNSISKNGAGSGGGISLKSSNVMSVIDVANKITARGGLADINTDERGGDGGGGRIAIRGKVFSLASADKIAQGASGEGNSGFILNVLPPRYVSTWGISNYNIAQRGTVYVYEQTNIKYSIKKTLIAVDRGGVASFNPYSLQKHDRINVKLNLDGVSGNGYEVRDELLKTRNVSTNFICKPVANTFSLDPVDKSADPLAWQINQFTNSISYDCIVN